MTTSTVSPNLIGLLVMASLSVACSSSDGDDSGSNIPEFRGLPGVAPGAMPGAGPVPGGTVTPAGTEAQGAPPLAAPGTPGAPTAGGAAAPTNPAAVVPAVPGTPSGIDVTIPADAVNRTTSSGVGFPMPGTVGQAVGGIEVGSVACFDNVDLTGVQSIDVSYARDGLVVSSSARFALLWGGPDVATAENLGEKLTTTTGGWETYQPLNVGLSRAVNEVGTLCFRGLQGNGILNLESFTLRGTPGTNDGVTNFNVQVPTGPAVAPVRVVDGEVQFGGPGTSVAGNSMFWSNGRYGGDLYYSAETVKWLKDDWGSQLVRAAMAADDNRGQGATPTDQLGGYLTHPFDNQFNVQKVVNAAIENGMYAIIDFHAHRAQDETDAAVKFFTDMATFYGGFDNVIYEIYNEPTGTDWPTIKAYAQRVIAAIRAVDPDNLIIVGTPTFSQEVDVAAADPIDDINVAYTLHFYAGEGAHADLRRRATAAMNAGIALFVTEWGTTPASGLGNPDANSTNTWMDFLKANNISHANWAVADQAQQGASQLVRGASPSGGWTDAQLSESGRLAKNIIGSW